MTSCGKTLRALALAVPLLAFATAAEGARAWQFTLLHGLESYTWGGLVMDGSGNLYGTSESGGSHNQGTVFGLFPNAQKTAWTYQILYNFCSKPECRDGSDPGYGGLILDSEGNLYGTTAGAHVVRQKYYRGNAFELVRPAHGNNWKLKVLHTFCALGDDTCTDGIAPTGNFSYAGASSGLPYDGTSALYGITLVGGTNSQGTAFVLNPPTGDGKWMESVLYNFCSIGRSVCTDGAGPMGISLTASGTLYGTTLTGGSNAGGGYGGTIFALSPIGDEWNETVLYNFCSLKSCADGKNPTSGLTIDPDGNFYGVAAGGTEMQGVLYKFVPDSSIYTVLHNFCSEGKFCKYDAGPSGTLSLDAKGDIFGTTTDNGYAGSIYRWDPKSGMHNLFIGYDGNYFASQTGVILDSGGSLFGTNGGEVFELSPESRAQTVLRLDQRD